MIHPTVSVDARRGPVVYLGDVEIGAYCVLVGPIEIGKGTKIGPHVVIGTDGEHRSRPANVGRILIGADVVIREFSAVQRGTGDRETSIGDGCLLMDHTHVAHDVMIGSDVTISPNVVLGGHTRVHRGATIGIGAMTHQFTTVGAYSMLGMGAVVTKDVLPFALVVGNPARYVRENTAGVARADGGRAAWYWQHFYADRRAGRGLLEEA